MAAKGKPPEIVQLSAAQLEQLLAEYDPSVGVMLARTRYGVG